MGTSQTRVFVKCSNCSVSFDLEFEKELTTDDGFDSYSISTKFIPETGAVFTFKTQHGYRPKVSVYRDSTYDSGSHKISNYGTLISDDAGSVANIPKEQGSFLIIAEAVSDSGINFTYDKTPKFREQETPHVYFDTVKGGSTRTETHTYTYEDASITGTRTLLSPITGNEEVLTYYKVHDFMTTEELIGQILGDMVTSDEAAITNEVIDDLSDNVLFQNYPGTIKFIADLRKRGGWLISLDSAYAYDDNAGNSVSFPEPGVYLSYDSILTITKEVQTSPSPFSKNVTVKAHTEYTAHANGKIGEGSSGDDSVLMSLIDRSITEFKNDSITRVGNGAFRGCSALTTLDLPNATSIGEETFGGCSALTTLDLPKVTSIGNGAFMHGCSALTTIDLPNVTSIGRHVFDGISSNAVINIGAAEGEISGAPWGAPEGVTINYNVHPTQEG